jgi:hypothetical protein
MNPRLSRGRAALLALCALATVPVVVAGCGSSDPADVRKVLPVTAIAFNDSVAAGDTLLLKVQYNYTTSCERVAKFEFTVLSTTPTPVYQVTPVAVYKDNEACTGVNGTDVSVLRVTNLGAGPRQFVVAGSTATLTGNVIASNDTNFVTNTGIGFRVRVEDATGGAVIPGAHVQIRDAIDSSMLSEGDADGAGIYAYDQACGPEVQYVISVSAAGRTANMVVRSPGAVCRQPEYVVIRV